MNSRLARFEALWGQRKQMESAWVDIERFMDPLRGGDFYSEQSSESEVEWTRPEVFDGTALDASNRMAKAMAGYMTSPDKKWFELNFRDNELNTNQEAKEWLQECGSRVYEALIDSNFNGEMASCYLDLVRYGNAFLMEEVENELKYDGISFSAVPIRECYFEPDHKDQIKHFYRKLQWTSVQIVDKFGEENCPDDIVRAARAGSDMETKHSVIFCIWERDDYKEISEDRPIVPTKERRWGYEYLLRKGGHCFSEGGYYERPVYVSRWEKTSGSYWGFGPGHLCVPTTNGVNEMRKLIKVRANKEVDSNWFAEQRNIVGDLDLEAGGLTIVKDINGIKAAEMGGNFTIAVSDLERDQEMIRSIFFADDLVLRDSPSMTATEVMERTERLIKLLGGVFGRLQRNLLNPCIERTFNILWRAGELPEAPDVVSSAGTNDVLDIDYTGALARAMKGEDVLAVTRWVNSLIQRAVEAQKMDILDVVDWDEISRGDADLLGVPAKYLKSREEVEGVREQRAEAEARAQEAALQQAEGEAAMSGAQAENELRAVQ